MSSDNTSPPLFSFGITCNPQSAMAPKNSNETPDNSSEGEGRKSATFRSTTIPNEDIMEDVGRVRIDEGQMWGKAILLEFKRTIGMHWVKEMTNFNQKTITVSMLMFITVIMPTLTFGAMYSKVTGNVVGTVETLLATSWVGCFMALFSGMPVAIIGSTGPVLAFSKAVIMMSESLDVPFLAHNAGISIWLFIYCCLACHIIPLTPAILLSIICLLLQYVIASASLFHMLYLYPEVVHVSPMVLKPVIYRQR